MSDNPQDTPLSRVLKRRKELQDAAKAIVKELEKIEEFLQMHRSYSGPEHEAKQGEERAGPQYILGGAGKGKTQEVFEQLVRAILLDARRPMQSPEIIAAFRERGHPIGGNETRTAWNRLWKARSNNVLKQIPHYGYWLADEPLPPQALEAPRPKRKRIDPETARRIRGVGKPVGRQPLLNEGQIKLLERWLVEGKKTQAEMARDLGGISAGTISNYRLALRRKREDQTPAEALKELHAERKRAAPSAKKKGSGRK
jgi:hypothetical protein